MERIKKGLFKIYQQGLLNRWLVLLLDLFIGLTSALLSAVATHFYLPDLYAGLGNQIWLLLLTGTFASFISSIAFKSYKQIFRYSSVKIGYKILWSTLLSVATLSLVIFIYSHTADAPVSLRAISLFISLYMMGHFILSVTSRGLLVQVARWVKSADPTITKQKERVLIFDVREISKAAAMNLEESDEYIAIGYITKQRRYRNFEIDGKSVYYVENRADLARLAHDRAISGIIFPSKSDFLNERKDFIYDCTSVGLATYHMPDISESSAKKITTTNVQEIKIEDLLDRDLITHDKEQVAAMYAGKVVMITGAAGSIGSELVKQISALGVQKLVLVDNAETPLHDLRLKLAKKHPNLIFSTIIGDVRSQKRLEYIFRDYRPKIVLHAAAYKHVPLMEENPCESVLVNVIGTKNIADLSVKYGVERMVMVSTDKAVNPTNVMGACKRAAEIYVQALGEAIQEGRVEGKTTFVTTRFGNVLGSRGSVFHLFREQIANGGPITVTHKDIVRYFMSIPEACSLILEASTLANGTQIFVFDMGEEHRIWELAEKMVRLAGMEPYKDIDIIETGLRPGEKLYEEVLATEENTSRTEIDKVMIAKVRPEDYQRVLPIYEQLRKVSKEVDKIAAVKLLKELIPEYASANSEFVSLDKDKQIV